MTRTVAFRWTASALLTLLALAAWARDAASAPLVLGGVSLALLAWWSRLPRGERLVRWIVLGVLAAGMGAAVAETRSLAALARAGEAWAIAARAGEVARAQATMAEVREALTRATAESARTGVPSLPAIAHLPSATLIYENGTLVTRAGQTWVPLPEAGANGVTWVRTAFHGALVARVRVGTRTVVSSALLLADAPADRYADPLLSRRLGTEAARALRFELTSVARATGASRDDPTSAALPLGDEATGEALLIRAVPLSPDAARIDRLERARLRVALPFAVAAVLILLAGWRRPARLLERLATIAGLLGVVALAPFGALSTSSALLDPGAFFIQAGGPFTTTLAAVLATNFLALLALFRLRRSLRFRARRPFAVLLLVAVAVVGPYALRNLARGIAIPAGGATTTLWIAWQLAIALAAAGILILGIGVGRAVIGARRGAPWWLGPTIAGSATLLAPLLWRAPGAYPAWYPAVFAVAIVATALVRDPRRLVTAVALVAGCGAVTLTWGAVTRERMQLAERDAPQIGAVDEDAYRLLGRWAETLVGERDAPTRAQLLRRYATSELARAGYPARLATWGTPVRRRPSAHVDLVTISDVLDAQASIAADTRAEGTARVLAAADGPFTIVVAAVPHEQGGVTTVAVPPRTRLLPPDPFAAFTGVNTASMVAPPYRLALVPLPARTVESGRTLTWERRGATMLGVGIAGSVGDQREARAEVELRGLDALVPRGALLVLLDVAVVLAAWMGSAFAGGSFRRWLRLRRRAWRRSYRSRLSLTLFAFFLLPVVTFALWEQYRVREDDLAARALVVREALRPLPAITDDVSLAVTAARVGQPLYAYRDGQLAAASDPLLLQLAPLGLLAPTSLAAAQAPVDFMGALDDGIAVRTLDIGGRTRLVGFRPFTLADGATWFLAMPARGNDFALDARRADLVMLVLFAAALGALAALTLSGVAARALARPIGQLRTAADAIAAEQPLPALDAAPPAEFAPVFGAVQRMADDLAASRDALDAARRRTDAALREVASGVVALRPDGTVMLANPRAEVLLARALVPDTPLFDGPLALPASIRAPIRRVFEDPGVAPALADAQIGARALRVAASPMPGGVVLTLDDVSELARAQRVLAWGEMARQVAHEIKNPLTPIRLGVQHLRRAWRDGRADYQEILETNVDRILDEIDHLDEIARAFSKYGTLPEEQPPPERTDVAAVARDVVALEQMGESHVEWQLTAPDHCLALARADALRDVLLNLLENARLAQATIVSVVIEPVARDGAGTIEIRVSDDGTGVDPEVLPRVFEPHFSTRTSGSGLGLAISRRVVDGWGGRIALEPNVPRGTTACVTLRTAPDAPRA